MKSDILNKSSYRYPLDFGFVKMDWICRIWIWTTTHPYLLWPRTKHGTKTVKPFHTSKQIRQKIRNTRPAVIPPAKQYTWNTGKITTYDIPDTQTAADIQQKGGLDTHTHSQWEGQTEHVTVCWDSNIRTSCSSCSCSSCCSCQRWLL